MEEVLTQIRQAIIDYWVFSLLSGGGLATMIVKALKSHWPSIADWLKHAIAGVAIVGIIILLLVQLDIRKKLVNERPAEAANPSTEEESLLSAEHMLDYECPIGNYSAVKSEFKIGCRFKNTATFPIELDLQAIFTGLDGGYYPRKKRPKIIFVLPPGGDKQIEDHPINLRGSFEQARQSSGFIYIRLKYGHPGKLDHELEIAGNVFFWLDSKGNATGKMYE